MKRILFSFIGLLFMWPVLGSWQLPVINYPQKEYASGTQNWQIRQQKNGWIYFANNYGLLEFDGNEWRTYGIWNSTVIRSLDISDDGTIYVGGTNEYGKFTSNDLGELSYSPLSLNVPDAYKNFGEVWNMHLLNGNIYIQTRDYFFKQSSDNQITVIEPKSRIFCSAKIHGAIFVATTDGIYLLTGNQLNGLRGSEQLAGREIRAMYAYGDNGVLIATDFGGLYLFDGDAIKPFHTDADAFIRGNQLYTMAVGAHYIAFGTVLNGLVITDIQGKNCRYINHENGLQNNTILSLFFDDSNNLWLGLDNGIDQIKLKSGIENLYGHSNFYGSGYTSLIVDNTIYLGTNQGLYYDSYPINQSQRLTNLKLIKGSHGQVWNLNKVNNTVFCCHTRGLFTVEGSSIKQLITDEGVWKVVAFNLDKSSAVAGSYSGLYILKKTNNTWKVSHKISNFHNTSRIFEVDANDRIWILTTLGIERIELSPDKSKCQSSQIMLHLQNDPNKAYNIHSFGGKLFISGPNVFQSVGTNGELCDATPRANLLGGRRLYSCIETDMDNNIWHIFDNKLYVCRYNKRTKAYEKAILVCDLPYFFIGGFEHITSIGNNRVIVGNIDGFALSSIPSEASNLSRNLFIRRITSTNANDSVIYGQSFPIIPKIPEISYKDNSLRFEFGGALQMNYYAEYSVKLEPLEETWGVWSKNQKKEYTALKEGVYTLHIRQRISNSDKITVSSVTFKILPPWYRAWWAYLFEVLLLMAIAYFIYRHIKKRVVYNQRKLEMKKDAEIRNQEEQFKEEALVREREIIKLKNERLEYELKSKSQELANILLHHINKNEILSEIKSDLKKVSTEINDKNSEGAQRRVIMLQGKITRNIEQNIDWNKFEENFDIVNDQFMKKITERYPWLNKNERKLCVYIKMGLLSKEIAPLINLSVRGVEMLRYRMRKKMELDRVSDLQGFFQLLAVDELSDLTDEGSSVDEHDNE